MEKSGVEYSFHCTQGDQLIEDLKREGFNLNRNLEDTLYIISRNERYAGVLSTSKIIAGTENITGLDDFLEAWEPPKRSD